MASIWNMMKHNLKMFFNTPIGFVLLFAPILLSTVMLGKMMVVNEVVKLGTVGVFVQQKDQTTDYLEEQLGSKGLVVKVYEEDLLHKAVEDGQVDMGISIKTEDFYQSLAKGENVVKFVYDTSNNIGKQIEGITTQQLAKLQMLVQKSGGDKVVFQEMLQAFQTKLPALEKEEEDKGFGVSIAFGFFVFIFLMVGGFSMSPIMREQEGKIYGRISMSTTKTYQYYIGHLLGSLCILILQVLIQGIVFQMLDIHTGIKLGAFMLIGSVLALISIALSMLILSLTKKVAIYHMVIGIGVTPLCMMSDCLVPIEMMPKWLSDVSYLSPIRWIMNSYQGMLQGESLQSILGTLGVAVVIAMVMILISIVIQYTRGYGER
ncbi:MAG: ABC transporter permease [Cellulosilyticaceae bacterium]